MKTVEPEWSWIAACPCCHDSIDQYDENVEEEGSGDDSIVTCDGCGEVFIVSMK
ncbi:hypothetical protein [Vibrio phage H188]|nr:hypothetical protein [Vibrio phage H188]